MIKPPPLRDRRDVLRWILAEIEATDSRVRVGEEYDLDHQRPRPGDEADRERYMREGDLITGAMENEGWLGLGSSGTGYWFTLTERGAAELERMQTFAAALLVAPELVAHALEPKVDAFARSLQRIMLAARSLPQDADGAHVRAKYRSEFTAELRARRSAAAGRLCDIAAGLQRAPDPDEIAALTATVDPSFEQSVPDLVAVIDELGSDILTRADLDVERGKLRRQIELIRHGLPSAVSTTSAVGRDSYQFNAPVGALQLGDYSTANVSQGISAPDLATLLDQVLGRLDARDAELVPLRAEVGELRTLAAAGAVPRALSKSVLTRVLRALEVGAHVAGTSELVGRVLDALEAVGK